MRILLNDLDLTLIISASIIGVFFLSVLIFMIIDHKAKDKRKFNDDPTLNYDQSYTIDLKNDVVKSFNLKTFRPLNTHTIKEFLDMFLFESRDKLLSWLNGFISNPVTEATSNERNVIVANYVISKNKNKNKIQICKALILCTHVDLVHKKINLEMELLLNTSNVYNKKHILKRFLYQPSSIKTSYEHGKFIKGAFVSVDIHAKENTYSPYNDLYLKTLMINELYKVISSSVTKVFYMGEKRRICLLEERTMDNFSLNKLINQIKKVIVDFFDLRGLNATYDYYLVGSLVSNLSPSFDESYDKLQKMFTIDQNLNRNFSIYEPSRETHYEIEESYRQEVDKVIRNSGIEVTFRPIAHIANKRIVNSGYMSFVSPTHSVFNSIDELRKFASMYDASKDIFSLILRKTIPIFTSEKENTQQRLALSMTIKEIPYAIRSLPHFSEIDKSFIILCFSSKELIDIENDENFIRNIKGLKEKGYDLGLFTSKDDYILKDKTYALFDYFFFDAKFESNVKSNSTSFLKAHQFLEKLIKYKTSIIVCYNSVNMQGIDFLVKAGIEYFSADCISPKSTQLLPLDKKISKKLLNMNK